MQLGLRYVPSFDASGVVIWALGVAAAAWATWTSAGRERSILEAEEAASRSDQGAVAGQRRRTDGPMGGAAEEEVHVTWMQAGLMLVMVCVMLLILYGLVRLNVPIVYALIFIFCMAGSGAVAQFYASPLVHRAMPSLASEGLRVPWIGEFTWNAIASTCIGLSVVVIWVSLRHRVWAFAL